MRVPVPAARWDPSPSWEAGSGTVHEAFVRHWRERPEDLVLADGAHKSGIADGARLDARTAAMAARLIERGVQPGDRVLWSARTTLSSVESLLAVLRAGAVLVPVSRAATEAELAHVVRDAGPVAVIDDGAGRRLAPNDGLCVLSVDELERADGSGHGAATVARDPGDDALIVYTSGTTGRPKGAVHTHASLLAGLRSLVGAWAWTREDRLALCLPLFHVHGLCAGLFGTLAAGASARLFDRFDPAEIGEAAEECSLYFGVPTMYHRLAAAGRAAELARYRLCVSGSAPLAADLWEQLHAAGADVLERYGMTETLLTLSNPVAGERRPGSVGLPLPGVEAGIDDPDEHGVGELVVRAPSVCRGYWGRSEPMAASDGFFASGDLASLSADGYVTIRGRRTELIITGGHNVYPAEVESVLSRHPGVVEVAVVGVASPEWGETVVAYVVGDVDVASLEDMAARELAPFKRPRAVRLVDALPRNAMGKVLRGVLRER